ncbi:polysaccharide pyruvyl transferase family protein [Gulosibacter faecalis]|jgi:polysaccharide pyruvyl transferase WcaK-like protein|uniref:Polysaccharide pyruvyl transferase family protein n=1 Tax=Gulosibacter faecalis TaxID=272240 RepID=A0ABW5V025_9MICO|nr:polysaccharide pyruvyl transferase family protein [Gulosibacter faecalis]
MSSHGGKPATTARLFYGHAASNWGDLAINYGAVELLREANLDVSGSTAVLLRPSDSFRRAAIESLGDLNTHDVPTTPRELGGEELQLVDYLENPTKFAADYEITPESIVVLNGGEHIHESSATPGNIIDLAWRVLPALAAAVTGARVVVLPSTLGPFRSQLGTAAREFLHASGAGALRDAASPSLAGGSVEQDWPVLVDAAFFDAQLKSTETEFDPHGRITIVARVEDFGLRAGTARSNFVEAKFRSEGYKNSRAYQLFYEIAARAIENGREVVIVVQTRSDRGLAVALHGDLVEAHPDARVSFEDPIDYGAFIDLLRHGNLVLTSRFHAAILALSQSVPAVGVFSETHGHKMPGLFELLKFPSGAVRLDDRVVEQVADEVFSAAEHVASTIEKTNEVIRGLKAETLKWFKAAVSQDNRSADTSTLRISALAALVRQSHVTRSRDDFASLKAKLAAIQATIAKFEPSS